MTPAMYDQPRRLSILFIVFVFSQTLAFGQQAAGSSAMPAKKLVPPGHGKIPVAFVIGRGAETIDVVGPWEVFHKFSTGVLGDWEGEVTTKEGPLQLAIHVWPYPDDKHLVGAADVLNRDVRDLFIDPITLNAQDLHFEIHNASGTYDGRLNATGTAIEGSWTQSGASAPLVLKRVKK